MPNLNAQKEHDRDARDLMALSLFDEGVPVMKVAEILGITHGPLVRLRKEIREDEKANAKKR